MAAAASFSGRTVNAPSCTLLTVMNVVITSYPILNLLLIVTTTLNTFTMSCPVIPKILLDSLITSLRPQPHASISPSTADHNFMAIPLRSRVVTSILLNVTYHSRRNTQFSSFDVSSSSIVTLGAAEFYVDGSNSPSKWIASLDHHPVTCTGRKWWLGRRGECADHLQSKHCMWESLEVDVSCEEGSGWMGLNAPLLWPESIPATMHSFLGYHLQPSSPSHFASSFNFLPLLEAPMCSPSSRCGRSGQFIEVVYEVNNPFYPRDLHFPRDRGKTHASSKILFFSLPWRERPHHLWSLFPNCFSCWEVTNPLQVIHDSLLWSLFYHSLHYHDFDWPLIEDTSTFMFPHLVQ